MLSDVKASTMHTTTLAANILDNDFSQTQQMRNSDWRFLLFYQSECAHLCARRGFTFIYKETPYCAKKNKRPTRVVLLLSVAIQPQRWNPISAVRVRGVT